MLNPDSPEISSRVRLAPAQRRMWCLARNATTGSSAQLIRTAIAIGMSSSEANFRKKIVASTLRSHKAGAATARRAYRALSSV
jgi:hypothetical protein